jgi:pilus assembly protein CpaE
VLQHESGLDVIPAPENAEPQRRLDPGALVRTLDFLRSRYEYILLDCPPGLTPETLELVRYCDHAYFITVPEVAAVRNVTRHINYFTEQGIPREKCEVVLNRHQRHSLITDTQIEKAIGASLSRRIPNAYMQAINVITAGAPASVPESSDMRQSLKEWAEALGGGTKDERAPKRGLLALWGR